MNESRVVVDTNVIFCALLRKSTSIRRLLLANAGHTFYCPRFFLVELFKHKERIAPRRGPRRTLRAATLGVLRSGPPRRDPRLGPCRS